MQGYAYAARMSLAPILQKAGEPKLASRLRRDARRLQQHFNRDFWLPGRRFYALALDGDRKPVESTTSNPAHGLWTGIIEAAHAQETIGRLMENDMFSGWGLRTLSGGNPRFNPIGYHLGSVWPHDNSIAAMGFKMYGFETSQRVATALSTPPALPLLPPAGAFRRRDRRAPCPCRYPVACRPQAWAAGAFPLITQAILGLKPEAPEKRLRIVNPKLPYWLNTVQVRNLRVGAGSVTLQYRREGNDTRVEIQEARGDIDVIISSRWPL